MRYLAVVLCVIPLLIGCEPYRDVDVVIPISNQSPYQVQLVVNDRTIDRIIPPNSPTSMTVKVQVPNSRSGEPTGPILDRVTNMKIEFYNVDLKRLSSAAFCDGGAKIRPSVTYMAWIEGKVIYDRVECRSLYYDKLVPSPDSASEH